MQPWQDLINMAATEIADAFKEEFLIKFTDGTSKKSLGVVDRKTEVSLRGDFNEIIDRHLAFSVPSSESLKKEKIKYIEYNNVNYYICAELEIKQGFTKIYLKRA